MSERRRRTPQQKKADEYDRDHHNLNAHGVWRTWYKVKARAHRASRRKNTRLAREATLAAHDPEAFEAAERRTIHRPEPVGKGGTPSVRERVRSQREARIWKVGWDRFFQRPYDREKHRESARRFLESLTEGRAGESVRLAGYFRTVLRSPRSGRGSQGVRGTTARWLDAFFVDEPAIEARFRRWIEDVARRDGRPGHLTTR